MANTFICEACGRENEKGWSDAEADKEYAETFPAFADHERALICDDCYKKAMRLADVSSILNRRKA